MDASTATEIAEDVLTERSLKNEPGDVTLEVEAAVINERGYARVAYRQYFDSVRVWHGSARVVLNPDGSVLSVMDSLRQGLNLESVEPALTAEEAAFVAEEAADSLYEESTAPRTELVVFRHKGTDYLARKVGLASGQESGFVAPEYFIDAISGEIVWVREAAMFATGTGNGWYVTGESFTTRQTGTDPSDVYRSLDDAREICVFDLQGTDSFTGKSLFQDNSDASSDNSWGVTEDDRKIVVDVLWGAQQVYDFYETVFSWTGLDDLPSNRQDQPKKDIDNQWCYTLGANHEIFDNAYFSPGDNTLSFGGGYYYDSSSLVESMTSFDTVAHEWTHGVSYFRVSGGDGFGSGGEQGTLNESWSDVLAAAAEAWLFPTSDHVWDHSKVYYPEASPVPPDLYDWEENIPGRYLYRPSLDTRSFDYPCDGFPSFTAADHYLNRYPVPPIQQVNPLSYCNDAGGVHHNAGIPNLAFFMLSEGVGHPIRGGSVDGYGISTVAEVWFAAQPYMDAETTFAGAHLATLTAAVSEFGPSHPIVDDLPVAWTLAGIDTLPDHIRTEAGTGSGAHGGDGGPGLSASFYEPSAIVVDSFQNLYIADALNNLIRKIDYTGTVSRFAGTGTAGFSGDGDDATSAKLNNPRGLAIDEDGNLYIADSSNHRIRKVNASDGKINTIAGTGTAGHSTSGTLGTNSKLNYPRGLALNSAGTILYIADRDNHRVRRYQFNDSKVYDFAGDGTAGNTGDGGAATSAKLNLPYAVAAKGLTDVYIADANNNRVRVVNSGNINNFAGSSAGTSGSTGDGGAATSAKLAFPIGLWLAEENSGTWLYIADHGNHRVRRVLASSPYTISAVAGTGTSGYSGEGGYATSANMDNPAGMTVDWVGNLHIADKDNHRIRKVWR